MRKRRRKFRSYHYGYTFTKIDWNRLKQNYKFEKQLKWVKQKSGFYIDSSNRFKILANGGNIYWRLYDMLKNDEYITDKFVYAKYIANKIYNGEHP